jgi:hypothetical protein
MFFNKIKTINLEIFFIVLMFFTGGSLVKIIFSVEIDLLILLIAVLIIYGHKFKINLDRDNITYYIFLSTVFIFVLSIIFSSIYVSDGDWVRLFKYISLLPFSIFIYGFISKEVILNYPKYYSTIIYYFTILAIISTIYMYLGGSEIYSFTRGNREYINYYFTWTIRQDGVDSTIINMFDFTIKRMQSFYEEPGTFGVLIPPALIYAIYKSNIAMTFILLIGLFLTFSIGAWIIALLLFILFFKELIENKLLLLVFFLLFLVLIILFYEQLWHIIQLKFGTSDIKGSGHSYAAREGVMTTTLEAIKNIGFFGFGASVKEQYYLYQVNTGTFFPHFVRGGLVGFIAFLFLYIILSYCFIKLYLTKGKGDNIFYAALIFTIIVASPQRATFMDSYFMMANVIIMYKYFYISKKEGVLTNLKFQ